MCTLRRVKRLHVLIAVLLGGVLLSSLGCGYTVVRYSEELGDVRRVAIVGITNDSFEPGASRYFSDALVREFLRRGAVRIVEDPALADLIIEGRIEELEERRRSFSSIQFALEYELRLRMELQVTRQDGTAVPIDSRALAETELYLASADVEVTRTNREEAIRRLAGIVAGRVHDALYERINP